MGAGWSTSDIPSNIAGKNVIVTGANSGIGYYTALEIGKAGANVIIACRNKERGEAALASLEKESKGDNKEAISGSFRFVLLDLSSLKDVERFANQINDEGKPIDILINNAGVLMPPYALTDDGFESQLATNHLGHFALTGRLMPSLKLSSSPRVVTVASIAAWRVLRRSNPVDFVKSEVSYDKMGVYGESKLANLLFIRELGRRYPFLAVAAAHPGATATNLQRYEFGYAKSVCQHAANGALPTIRAAVDPLVKSVEAVSSEEKKNVTENALYFGPRGLGWSGCPSFAWFPLIAKDDAYAAAYWDASVKATGVDY